MGEHVYQFGDPVWVKINGQHEEWKGFYVREDGGMHHVAYKRTNALRGEIAHFTPLEIRYRLVAPVPTGWRLPEPGDVVTVHGSNKSRTIREVHWIRPDPIKTDDGQWWYVSSCEPVRLHDDPSPPPAPVEPKPEIWVSFDKDEAQRLLGDLDAASCLSQWLQERESGSYRKSVQSVIGTIINEVSIALGANQ